jgi:hypothetical protein
MKIREQFLVIALGMAVQATAAPTASPTTAPAPNPQPQPMTQNAPSAEPSAATTTPKKTFYWFAPAPSDNKQYQITRYGNTSSRPWEQTVGWHQGESQFPSGENHQSQLVLVQFPWGR